MALFRVSYERTIRYTMVVDTKNEDAAAECTKKEIELIDPVGGHPGVLVYESTLAVRLPDTDAVRRTSGQGV